ncbi:MAG: PIN domain-containing protein [Terriglobia bacterium]
MISTTAYFRPAETALWNAVAVGAALAVAAILLEIRLQRVSVRRLIGIAGGLVVGLICAALISLVLGRLGTEQAATLHFTQVICLLLFVYLGAVTGAAKGELLNLGKVFGAEVGVRTNHKILDTSVIIDGRIADIADTGFLDGVLVIPQFVLQELQMVADSADSMKRNRGRRGLDVLQRIQKMSHLKVEIVQEDFPHIREVDMKLIELAQLYNCRIVTNDFNLNKVAHVRGVDVLNINELANSVKPIVLPGELMRVFILKEGKEYNQGVAYLDDGTMVVVDNARRMIAKTVDVSVTSVLQTTAGKMIFGKYDERQQSTPAAPDRASHAAAGASSPLPPSPGDRPGRREQAVGEN